MKLVYRFRSEDAPPIPLRLKVEINSREHFSHLGLIAIPFHVASRWFQGVAEVGTFSIEEILGIRLRALYQRKKGRDLFDLWFALENGGVNEDEILACFHRCMEEQGNRVSRAQFEENLWKKGEDLEFRRDIAPCHDRRLSGPSRPECRQSWESWLREFPESPGGGPERSDHATRC